MVNFVLEYLNSTVKMDASGALPRELCPVDASAIAVLYVSVKNMRMVFQYQIDPETATTKYYIDTKYWPLLNPANARLDTSDSLNPIAIMDNQYNLLPPNKMFLVHDYIRYLALQLFGTHHSVNMFQNEMELINDMRKVMGYDGPGQVWYELTKKLFNYSIRGSHSYLKGEYGRKHMTNATLGESNMCRILLETLQVVVPHRFQRIENMDVLQQLPFEVGDTLSFKIIMEAAEGQELLTGVAPIGNRSYEIKLVMVDDPVNIEPSPEELIM